MKLHKKQSARKSYKYDKAIEESHFQLLATIAEGMEAEARNLSDSWKLPQSQALAMKLQNFKALKKSGKLERVVSEKPIQKSEAKAEAENLRLKEEQARQVKSEQSAIDKKRKRKAEAEASALNIKAPKIEAFKLPKIGSVKACTLSQAEAIEASKQAKAKERALSALLCISKTNTSAQIQSALFVASKIEAADFGNVQFTSNKLRIAKKIEARESEAEALSDARKLAFKFAKNKVNKSYISKGFERNKANKRKALKSGHFTKENADKLEKRLNLHEIKRTSEKSAQAEAHLIRLSEEAESALFKALSIPSIFESWKSSQSVKSANSFRIWFTDTKLEFSAFEKMEKRTLRVCVIRLIFRAMDKELSRMKRNEKNSASDVLENMRIEEEQATYNRAKAEGKKNFSKYQSALASYWLDQSEQAKKEKRAFRSRQKTDQKNLKDLFFNPSQFMTLAKASRTYETLALRVNCGSIIQGESALLPYQIDFYQFSGRKAKATV